MYMTVNYLELWMR